MQGTRYAFEVEWADGLAGQKRSYVLCFYPGDRHNRTQVEMIDKKLKRVFLRKTATDIKLDELFIGAQVG